MKEREREREREKDDERRKDESRLTMLALKSTKDLTHTRGLHKDQ